MKSKKPQNGMRFVAFLSGFTTEILAEISFVLHKDPLDGGKSVQKGA